MLNEEFYDLVDKLALINEDAEEKPVKPVSVEELEKASNEEKPKEGETKEGEAKETQETETDDSENISKAVKDAIKPQVDVASSIINSLKDAYADNCNSSKELSVMTDQIKNWEKTIRGACQTIVDTVKNKKLFKTDADGNWVKGENGKYLAWNGKQINKVFSPKAFSWLKDNGSRDRSTLDLCAAIMVFYNSIVV
jgi:hypothetical protein